MDVGVAIAFWTLAVLGVGSSLAVVLLRDIFRAALFLVLSFLTVAGIYIILQADFLAAAQILIYVGAISILLIFAIMLTRDIQRGNPSNKFLVPGLFMAGIILSAIIRRHLYHRLASLGRRALPRLHLGFWPTPCSISLFFPSRWPQSFC